MKSYKMWTTDKQEKINQVADQPEGTEFYLFSTKWTNPFNGKSRKYDDFVKIWWGHNGSGYTYDLNEAGKYSREKLLNEKEHYLDSGIFPLPCHLVEAGEFGRVMRSVYN